MLRRYTCASLEIYRKADSEYMKAHLPGYLFGTFFL